MLLADPATVADTEHRMWLRMRAPDYTEWRAKVHAVGGCAQPIRLTGRTEIQHAPTGTVLHAHGGNVLVPCGNRRASVCPACSDRYAANAYHLMSAGLAGGAKGVPEKVTEHPRSFVTLTAPSFGPVHSAGTTVAGRRRRCRCGESHHDADTRIGAPLDPDAYDYVGAVLWQANSGALWSRFVENVRRSLAAVVGMPVRAVKEHVRVSYGKVSEFQRRGLIHFHAVDAPGRP